MRTEIIKNEDYTLYSIDFLNITDLYNYLKSDPEVNNIVFNIQSSLSPDSFYGESLNKSIEYLNSGYKIGLNNFLKANKELVNAELNLSDNRKLARGLYGGIPLSPLVASGVPDCMLRYERDNSATVRNVYYNLGYPSNTRTNQIINRGLATLYIIQALEEKGEMINFNAFELALVYDEIVDIKIYLKKPGEIFLDIEKCYFPIVAKEFLRRILFRVLESVPVQNFNWFYGYGRPATVSEIIKIKNATEKDLIISSPNDMGIKGENIYDDTISMINSLDLENEFDVEKIKALKLKNK